MSNFLPPEVVCRASETQIQVGENKSDTIKRDIKTKFPCSYFGHACPKKEIREFRLYISPNFYKYASQECLIVSVSL